MAKANKAITEAPSAAAADEAIAARETLVLKLAASKVPQRIYTFKPSTSTELGPMYAPQGSYSVKLGGPTPDETALLALYGTVPLASKDAVSALRREHNVAVFALSSSGKKKATAELVKKLIEDLKALLAKQGQNK